MRLIDLSFFVNENYIPNINGTSDVNDAISQGVDRFINIYEIEFLKILFGETFYDELIAGIENNEALYLSIKSKLVDEENKISPIVNYIYCRYVQSQTANGEQNENPNFFNQQRFIISWNRMVGLNFAFANWFQSLDVELTTDDSINTNEFDGLFTTVNSYI